MSDVSKQKQEKVKGTYLDVVQVFFFHGLKLGDAG